MNIFLFVRRLRYGCNEAPLSPLPAGRSSSFGLTHDRLRSGGWSPLSLFIACILTLTLAAPLRANAQTTSLYSRIRSITDSEFLLGENPDKPHTADPSVRSFISTVYVPPEGPV